MLNVIIIMSLGIAFGYILRHKETIIKKSEIIVTILIYLLLFFLGITVGLNKEVVTNIPVIGLKALILTFAAIAGSIISMLVVHKLFYKVSDHER